jgi:hypothetical protein
MKIKNQQKVYVKILSVKMATVLKEKQEAFGIWLQTHKENGMYE